MEKSSQSLYPISSDSETDYWKHHIRCWKESGMSKRSYCEQEEIGYHVFEYRYRKLYGKQSVRSSSMETGFIQISSINNCSLSSFSDSGIRLSVSDAHIELSCNFDESSLSRVLKVLKES